MKVNKLKLRQKSLLGVCLLWCFMENLCAATIGDGFNALNAGQLRTAQGIFEEISKNQAESTLTRAIAYKNLGTVLFRLGKPSKEAFAAADDLFVEMLKKSDSSELKEQYGFMLYQRANCLLTACENQLSKAKMQGIPAIPFEYLKNYISPATEYLNKAKQFYPQKQRADLSLLELDLLLSETHIWTACRQEDSARRSRNKALELVDKAVAESAHIADTKKKLLLRKATLLCELPQSSDSEIRTALTDAIKIESGNIELDISVFTVYAKYILTQYSSSASTEYNDLEEKIQTSISKIEKLREENLEGMDFVARKNYFATRTELYEVLLMLYAKQNRPFDMLLAINQVRSRAIQDEIDTGKIKSQEQIQKILSENQAMLLAYYVGYDHIWSVCFTGITAEIASSKHSGQELAAMGWNVIQIYSDIQHVQTYLRHGSRYKIVPEAFDMSHSIYEDIFAQHHQNFKKNKLKHLYIIPHNVLNYLPFSALAVKTDPEDVFKTNFVADEETPISYLTSVHSLLISSPPISEARENIIFARGDYSYPAFYNNDPENPDNPNAPPLNLPNVPSEGAAVAKMLKVAEKDFFTEKNASEFNLMQRTSSHCSIVHIASHAHLNAISPLESYVVLAAGHGCDGKVKVNELLTKYRGKIHADLLVLSACNTNRGESNLVPGDDIAALSNAFLVAGAKNVIATEWLASDTSFPVIMESFYSKLANGIPDDTALAQAIKSFISQKNQIVMRYPLFWANIVLNGGLQKN